jgi:hypothetical protein
MRVLSPRIHGYLDFAVVAVFLLAPLAVGLGGTPALISYLLAIVHLLMTLMTRFPAGIYKTIPLMVHGFVELAVAIFLVLLPYIAGFGPGSPAKRFYVTMAAIIFIVWLLTDYRGANSDNAPVKS